MSQTHSRYLVRQAEQKDIPEIIEFCRAVYRESPPWTTEQLNSHQKIFPEGQLVVFCPKNQELIGMASSLIVNWDDYNWESPWKDFTDRGMFTNHDPKNGRTLYGAEIMVHPKAQGTGAGSLLYRAREALVLRLKLLRIRAGARLRGYHKYASKMSAEDYVLSVNKEEIKDPTLSFQLKRGFQVLRLVEGYLRHDPESLGFAAVIEWINLQVARPKDYDVSRSSKFYKSRNI